MVDVLAGCPFNGLRYVRGADPIDAQFPILMAGKKCTNLFGTRSLGEHLDGELSVFAERYRIWSIGLHERGKQVRGGVPIDVEALSLKPRHHVVENHCFR